MIEKLLEIIGKNYPLTSVSGVTEEKLRAGGMKFSVQAYRAEGLGHVSVMTAKGFFGLMRMDTLIINPTELDLPLYSYDRIYAMGNDTLIIELYDTMSECGFSMKDVKEKYKDLSERDPGEHWYDSIKLSESVSKKCKKVDTPRLDSLTVEHINAYFDAAKPTDNTELKREKARAYVDGLLLHGGPSTDAFKKAIGEERTARLFRDTLFGTK